MDHINASDWLTFPGSADDIKLCMKFCVRAASSQACNALEIDEELMQHNPERRPLRWDIIRKASLAAEGGSFKDLHAPKQTTLE